MSSIVIFFFFKQKTAYEMRISDWSSDVCSSDLVAPFRQFFGDEGIFCLDHGDGVRAEGHPQRRIGVVDQRDDPLGEALGIAGLSVIVPDRECAYAARRLDRKSVV